MGRAYVRQSYLNVKALTSDTVEELPTRQDVEKMLPGYQVGADVAGGYVNWGSGWSDAEAAVRFAKQQLDKTGRVDFRKGDVRRLISVPEPDDPQRRRKVTGVELTDGNQIMADLVILATGAWTGRLVDLRGRAEATGQVLSYLKISDEEQAKLGNMPILLNFSTGIFIIPPRNNLLKVARHAYGYRNPMQVPDPAASEDENQSMIEISVPENGVLAPMEGQDACRKALRQMLPAFADRPFVKTRVCWYTDRYVTLSVPFEPFLPCPFLPNRAKGDEERRKANPHHLTNC
jgi:sarcosine oxidase/L-pipecolate oxidase